MGDGNTCIPQPVFTPPDLVELAQSVDALSTLVQAVIAGGLVPVLQGPGPFTVFAPTNDAFAALGQATVTALLADHDRLVDILTYHVLPVEVHSADLSDGMHATTVEGNDLTVRIVRGTVAIIGDGSQARVVQADVQASNGVVHVIDSVLLPPAPAAAIVPPAHLAGEVATGGQLVTYTMQADAGSTYTIESSASGANPITDTYLTIYDTDGTTELAHDDDSGQGTQALLTWTAPASGDYTVEVRGYNRVQTGTFELDVTADVGGASPCSGGVQLQGTQGVIAFADTPYANSANCMWSLSCPAGQMAHLEVTSMDTEANFDFITVTDGSNQAQLMHASGTATPDAVSTSSSEMTVEFNTDGSVTRGGFEATYSCSGGGGGGGGGGGAGCTPIRIDARPVQGEVSRLDASNGVGQCYSLVATGGETYDVNVELLTLPDSVLSIVDSRGTEIERNDDDGGSLASHLVWTVPATGTYTLQVEAWRGAGSDGGGGRGGTFTLEVTSLGGAGGGGSNPCEGGVTLTDDAAQIDFDDTGILSSTCDWTIRCTSGVGITFTFDTFAVETNFDYVSMYDGGAVDESTQILHATGRDTPPVVTATGRQLTIEYTSDGSVNGGGFSGSYYCGTGVVSANTPVTPDGPVITGSVDPSVSSREDGGQTYTLTATGGTTYQIEVTLGTLTDSVLAIYAPDGTTQLVENDDYGGTLSSYIEWTCPSDGSYFVVVRGFSARNTGDFSLAVTSDAGTQGGGGGDPCNGGLNLNAPSAIISYQPRGQYENNVQCWWAVTCPVRGDVPSFTFTALDTENGYDFVTISDGNQVATGSATLLDRVSGTIATLNQVSYQSGSSSMTIGFTTDGSVSGVGFEGSYACGRPATTEPTGPTCEDTMEELNGAGACTSFIAQGFSCAQRFCSTCTFSNMCDSTCGFCGTGGDGGDDGTPDIVTLAQSVDALSTLVQAVIAGGLVPVLQGPGPFTVFAPTNDAFAALGQATVTALLADHDRLVDVLTYHVLPVEVHSSDLRNGMHATTVEGGDLTVRINRGTVTINGDGSRARVVQADVQASNGVVHVIDSVLLPPAHDDGTPDIVTLAQSVDALSTLVQAVIAGGLVPVLQGPGPFTVFAPTNDAFAALGQATVTALLADHDRLVDVLTYHVLPVEVHSADLSDGMHATTVEGGDLSVSIFTQRFQPTVVTIIGGASQAHVVQADVQASNGVVHVIDTVLLPTPPSGCTADGSACVIPHVDTYATDGPANGWTTYRLSAELPAVAQNLYTIFGSDGSAMSFPPAWQSAPPFGTNIGGANPQFFPIMPACEFDSFLTVGITDGSNAGAISSIGIEFQSWSEDGGLDTSDGAVFWMDPTAPQYNRLTVVAQITTPSGSPWTARMGMQGKSRGEAHDWEVDEVEFTNDEH
jgi:transforming growth factor-beta-induced protein